MIEMVLDSESIRYKMLGDLKLFLELTDKQNVVIYKNERKGLRVVVVF